MYKQNSYNKNKRDPLISHIYFGIELYMFRTCASRWFLLQEYITMHGPLNVQVQANVCT